MTTARIPLIDLMLLVVLATLWGASYAFIKVGVQSIPPVTLIAARTLIGGAVLLSVIRYRRMAMPRGRAIWGRFAVQACLNSVVPFTLIAWAEQTVDAGLATILNALSPVFAFLMAWLLRQEVATASKSFGVLIGLAGVGLVVGIEALGGWGRQLAAQLAIVLATICYAGAAMFGRNFGRLDPMLPAAGSLLCGAALLMPLSLVVDRPWQLAPSTDSVMALLGLAVFSTALALVIYFRLVRTLGAVGTTAQAYLRVPVGVGIGVVFLDESLAPTAWLGLLGVVAGVAAMTWTSQCRSRSS